MSGLGEQYPKGYKYFVNYLQGKNPQFGTLFYSY